MALLFIARPSGSYTGLFANATPAPETRNAGEASLLSQVATAPLHCTQSPLVMAVVPCALARMIWSPSQRFGLPRTAVLIVSPYAAGSPALGYSNSACTCGAVSPRGRAADDTVGRC